MYEVTMSRKSVTMLLVIKEVFLGWQNVLKLDTMLHFRFSRWSVYYMKASTTMS